MILEATQRRAVVDEAYSWLRTPYHEAARVKGAGVDCAMLPLEVYRSAGLVPDFEVERYPPDWHLHRSTERYLEVVRRFATEVPAPTAPGDFVLYQWGRCYAHGAIIVGWPEIIHAVIDVGVRKDSAEELSRLIGRPRLFFTLWPRSSGSQRVAGEPSGYRDLEPLKGAA